jgi:hypothetical protein
MYIQGFSILAFNITLPKVLGQGVARKAALTAVCGYEDSLHG